MNKVVQATFPYLWAIIAASVLSAGPVACGSSSTTGSGGGATTATSSTGSGGGTTGSGGSTSATTTTGSGGSTGATTTTGTGGGGGSTTTTGTGGMGGNAPTCSDGIKNGAESDTDCGGPACPKCELGKTCGSSTDCAMGDCIGGICDIPAPTCSDGMKNGTESDVDCGGNACPTCADGKTCGSGADCMNGICKAGVCTSPTCNDGMKNGSETDADCGGPTCAKCANGKICGAGTDCQSGNCAGNVCAAPLPTCNDGMKNGAETDVDCGGPTCAKCANGKVCGAGTDCTSGNCMGNVCAAPLPTCNDGMKNGNETDTDCGGPTCAKCVNGKVCGAGTDCQSGSCSNNVCAAPPGSCNDGVKNGNESDIDCGGACPLCANGKTCGSLADCQSASCASGTCAAIGPTCTDAMKNGNETDVDCGGGTCGKCANGKACLAKTDCLSAGCVGNVCSVVAATCSDGLKNGTESDVDCGGAACPKCAVGKTCGAGSDCVIIGGAAQCQNNVCIVPFSACNDKVKNGTETDIDCGGNACGHCSNGWICNVGTDCKSGMCTGNICVAASVSCADGIKNGGETDTDCGGPVCPKCAAGQTCSNVGDCSSGSCVLNACGSSGAFQSLWSRRYGNATDQECDNVRTDANENVFMANYVTGIFDYGNGNVGSGEEISLVKLNPAGTALWSKAYLDGTKQYPYGFAVDAAGKLFLSGGYYFTLKFGTPVAPITAAGSDDLYAASFGNTGASLWAKSFGDAAQFQQFNKMTLDLQGNSVMTGWLSGNANFGGGVLNGSNQDIIVVKLDKNGNHLWSKKFGNGSTQGGSGIAVDSAGNVVVVGFMNGSVNFGGGAIGPGGSSIFLLKLDQNGAYVWAKAFASTQDELKPHIVVTDAAGNIFIGGGKRGTINFGGGALATSAGVGFFDAYLAKFDSSGNHVWSKNYGNGEEQWVDDITVDGSGNVIATGSFNGTINFGGGVMNSLGGTEFGGDIFLAKLSAANGTQLFAAKYGDATQQEPKSLTLDASGNLILCGLFHGSVNFGSGMLSSAGANDIFITKMTLP